MGSRLFGEKLPPGFLWQDGYELHTNEGAEYSLAREEFGGLLPRFSSQVHFSKGRRYFCPYLD